MVDGWLLGPFAQIVTMDGLPTDGPMADESLVVIEGGGLLVDGGIVRRILSESEFRKRRATASGHRSITLGEDTVLLPGFVDSHTHMCYAGSRLDDYLGWLQGTSREEVARRGGGIMSTVRATRKASERELAASLTIRVREHLMRGITTAEVKSGYGLDERTEIKMLKAIRTVDHSRASHPKLVPTFLAAHMLPPDERSERRYLASMLPVLERVRKEGLADRVDGWVDKKAFSPGPLKVFLRKARRLEFAVTVHADQFEVGGSVCASETGAVSADHLELSGEPEIKALLSAGVAATVLPGSSLGLGRPFAKARLMLDAGLSVVIASDWNPGTAPSGDLLAQASILAAEQRLSVAETLAGITCRAARVLGLADRGTIREGGVADLVGFPCERFEEIVYRQGALRPSIVVSEGNLVDISGRGG